MTVKGHAVLLEIERASERGLGFISVKHCCIYRSSLKRFPAPFHWFPLLHFQLAPDGWSNAIRSNYSSHVRLLSVCPRLRTDTHSSDGKVSYNSVQLLSYHPFIPPPFHPFILSLVFIHLPLSWDTVAHCTPASYLPPHLPAHGSLSATAHYFYFLTIFFSFHFPTVAETHSLFISVQSNNSQNSFPMFYLLIRLLSTEKKMIQFF